MELMILGCGLLGVFFLMIGLTYERKKDLAISLGGVLLCLNFILTYLFHGYWL